MRIQVWLSLFVYFLWQLCHITYAIYIFWDYQVYNNVEQDYGLFGSL